MASLRIDMLRRIAALSLLATACGGTTGSADDDVDSSIDGVGDVGSDPADRVDGGISNDAVHPEGAHDADTEAADGVDAFVPTAELVPEATEVYVVPTGREEIRPHRHAVPAALGSGIYGVVVDVDRSDEGLPLTVGLYRFDPGALDLRQVWIDEPGMATEYNSICWTGEAFVVALPTHRVGLRVGAFAPDGRLLREPVVLEPDAAYSPAGAGQPPAVLCPEGGAVAIDHGRGVGGTDRLYALDSRGTYAGTFVDADLPAFTTTPFYASSPCAVVSGEAACATTSGLVFVRRDGSLRVSDEIPAPGICPPGTGCDVARTDDGLAVAWAAPLTDRLALSFARFAIAGSVAVSPTRGPTLAVMSTDGIRAASSGTTVLVSGPPYLVDTFQPREIFLFDTSGTLLAPSMPAGACGDHASEPPPDCPFPSGGSSTTPVFWEGDAYAALWVPEGPWADAALVYRRFRVVEL